ncbi:MAG: hypothetical protein IKU48_02905 [Clostridia bacterium]|nr:hypothetical protein [Clostridia bacterium]
MLEIFLDIILAFLAVYGGYCLYINLVYIFFCKEKSNICLAYMLKEKNSNFSEIFLAKKLFLGRSRVIIVVECDSGIDCPENASEEALGTPVYRAERIDRYEGNYH